MSACVGQRDPNVSTIKEDSTTMPRRRLITCPVCGTDQHVYRDKLVRHRACSAFSVNCDASGWEVSPYTGQVKVPLGDRSGMEEK